MSTPRVQNFASLREEMIAVARGERKAPPHAAEPSVHSADLIARLLTPENRFLMATIRERRPASVAELASLTQRAPSNLTRTLEKLAAVGLVYFESSGNRKAPRTIAGRILIEIDPFSAADTIQIVTTSVGKPGNATGVASKASPRKSATGKPQRARKSRTSRPKLLSGIP